MRFGLRHREAERVPTALRNTIDAKIPWREFDSKCVFITERHSEPGRRVTYGPAGIRMYQQISLGERDLVDGRARDLRSGVRHQRSV